MSSSWKAIFRLQWFVSAWKKFKMQNLHSFLLSKREQTVLHLKTCLLCPGISWSFPSPRYRNFAWQINWCQISTEEELLHLRVLVSLPAFIACFAPLSCLACRSKEHDLITRQPKTLRGEKELFYYRLMCAVQALNRCISKTLQWNNHLM